MTLQVTPQVSKVIATEDTPKLLTTFIGASFIVSGLTPSAGTGLTLNIAPGSALINGYLVEDPDGDSLTLTDNATNYVYLKLTKNAQGKVNGAQYEVNTTGTQPQDSIIICEAVTSGGTITSITDKRDFKLLFTRNLDMQGNDIINIGSLKTSNLMIREASVDMLEIRDANNTTWKHLQVSELRPRNGITAYSTLVYFRTMANNTSEIQLKSHDGTAYRTGIKLIGGQAEWYSWDGTAEQLVARGNAGYFDLERARLSQGEIHAPVTRDKNSVNLQHLDTSYIAFVPSSDGYTYNGRKPAIRIGPHGGGDLWHTSQILYNAYWDGTNWKGDLTTQGEGAWRLLFFVRNTDAIKRMWIQYGEHDANGIIPSFSTLMDFRSTNEIASVNLIPLADAVYDLGNGSYRWRDGYFAGVVEAGGLGGEAKRQVFTQGLIMA